MRLKKNILSKKTCSFAISVVMAASLVGCGSSGDENNTTTSDNESTETASSLAESDDWQGSLEGVTLSFGTPGTYGPFSYFDEDGTTVIGYDLDFLNKLQELLGFEIDDQGIQTMDYAALTTSVAEGKLDMVIGGLAMSDERKEVMNFSDGYYDSSYTILVNSDSSPKDITGVDTFLDESSSYKVACGNGTAVHLILQKNGVSDDRLDIYDDVPTAIQALEAGKTDAMAYDNAGASYYINTTDGTKIEKVGDVFAVGSAQYGVALSYDICDEYPELLDSINAAISYLKDEGFFDEMQEKWIG